MKLELGFCFLNPDLLVNVGLFDRGRVRQKDIKDRVVTNGRFQSTWSSSD